MDKYAELMCRHEKMRADWMRRVRESKERLGEGSMEFYSQGIRLLKDGSLENWARDPRTHDPLWVLSMAPGDERVRITFPDKTTYLV